MDVTIEMIAEKAKVSRGTVDRVIHDRGRVNPETAERIRRIMSEMDYQPNSLGRAFAIARQKIKIGVLVSQKEKDFQEQIMQGVRDGVEYAGQHGFETLIRFADADDNGACDAAIEEFREENVGGIALRGILHDGIRKELKALRKKGVRVVAFNSDMDAECRDCFVGQNHLQSGECAAFLMQEICHTPGNILVVGVSPEHRASAERISSFRKLLAAGSDGLAAGEPFYCNGHNEVSYQIVADHIGMEGGLSGVFVSGAGLSGACQAVVDAGLSGKVKMIGFDTIQPNVHHLVQGTVQFLIDQNPYQQGYLPLRIITESLFYGRKITDSYIDTGIEIKSRYNIAGTDLPDSTGKEKTRLYSENKKQ